MAEPGHRCEVIQNYRPELRHVRRKKIAPMQWRASGHERMLVPERGAEIDALLKVGPTGGELRPDRKVSSPGSAAPRHVYFELLLCILRGETAAARESTRTT